MAYASKQEVINAFKAGEISQSELKTEIAKFKSSGSSSSGSSKSTSRGGRSSKSRGDRSTHSTSTSSTNKRGSMTKAIVYDSDLGTSEVDADALLKAQTSIDPNPKTNGYALLDCLRLILASFKNRPVQSSLVAVTVICSLYFIAGIPIGIVAATQGQAVKVDGSNATSMGAGVGQTVYNVVNPLVRSSAVQYVNHVAPIAGATTNGQSSTQPSVTSEDTILTNYGSDRPTTIVPQNGEIPRITWE